MKVLFLSRAYPPVVGGIENHNHALAQWLPRHLVLRTLANRGGKRALPWFLPWALLYALLNARRFDVLLLGDGVLACVGWLVKWLLPQKTVVCVIHGLDLTWQSKLYQRWWPRRFMPALDGFIAVSNETRRVALALGLAGVRVVVIPNGVDCAAFAGSADRAALARVLGCPLEGKLVLLTAGRLARRKGAAWFIQEVMPLLPGDILYVVAGGGPEAQPIRTAVAAHGLQARVFLPGAVDDATRDLLLRSSDVFIQPNIAIPGDMEGFGIAVLEAGASGLPVVASALEGLLDAISPGHNGLLVPSAEAQAWRETLLRLRDDQGERIALGVRARQYTQEHHDWAVISQRYAEALRGFRQQAPMR